MTTSGVQDLLYVVVFGLGILAFLGLVLGLSRLLRPSVPLDSKYVPYECGMDQLVRPWARFNMRYYYFGLLFVLFDVETVLLFAVATQFRVRRFDWMVNTSVVALFAAMVLGALAYAWRKGALKWQ